MFERTFVMIKPDGVGRRLCGDIIRRYESKGLRLAGLKMRILTREDAERLYAAHADRPFFAGLIDFMISGPTIQMVWEGPNAVKMARSINGATDCQEAAPGTIRGDYGVNTRKNLVHASDSVETARREMALYFTDSELWNYSMPDGHWLAEL
ncbi:MAG TPA: nucleoside-diphosphate kinase [Candidatus Hydrogenedentes bacterium]|nr:nucleoside-diphosphate kinase [Candidatus Hydrogenedentota bacterium]HOT49777.1 nucleoside-diphosphate kinase [Candidatus Hydrogenedentota bacterium]HOV74244.1 nucleoside-diphosphate kinase [Candidatus Hydrogenedentota bacterium]HPC15062.1 nucleoside-diphosphate kinase [Candidatus Hydrogenedentota bacterium]HRT19077.1 nucleoside-diphosphate kinase [Candidatus Hydrogenedentota bacterium]